MSKVKINPEKLRVAEDMQPSEELGTLVYAKKTAAGAAREDETDTEETKDAAGE